MVRVSSILGSPAQHQMPFQTRLHRLCRCIAILFCLRNCVSHLVPDFCCHLQRIAIPAMVLALQISIEFSDMPLFSLSLDSEAVPCSAIPCRLQHLLLPVLRIAEDAHWPPKVCEGFCRGKSCRWLNWRGSGGIYMRRTRAYHSRRLPSIGPP